MKICFVVCPIGHENSETRKRSDTLYKHIISPVCKDCGFDPVRIDQENTNGSLTEEIISHVSNDALVIADLTESNPNAFYEIGYRAALKKPIIHLMQKDTSIPFDVSSIRAFTYDLHNLDAVEETKSRLVQTIHSLDLDSYVDSSSAESIPAPASSPANTVSAQILQEIFKLQDSITKLSEKIDAKDATAVSVLADKLATANTKTSEAVMIEALLPMLMNNPEQFIKMASLLQNPPS